MNTLEKVKANIEKMKVYNNIYFHSEKLSLELAEFLEHIHDSMDSLQELKNVR
jgi:hypothetical protein